MVSFKRRKSSRNKCIRDSDDEENANNESGTGDDFTANEIQATDDSQAKSDDSDRESDESGSIEDSTENKTPETDFEHEDSDEEDSYDSFITDNDDDIDSGEVQWVNEYR